MTEAVLDAETAERPPPAELSAADALRMIAAGEPISDVRIVGLKMRGEFSQPVEFKHVTLVRPQFRNAQFAQSVRFLDCTLNKPKFSSGTTFEDSVNFAGSKLVRASFDNLKVVGEFRCDNIRSVGQLRFGNVEFLGSVRFWEARFEGWIDVRDCRFVGQGDFRSFHATEGVMFQRCQFENEFLLRGATVSKKLDFGVSRFNALVDFSKAKLHDYVYLEQIEQGDEQRFAFANAVAERILVSPEQLTGRVDNEVRENHELAMQEYGFLKRNFGSLHRYDDEDWAYYRFKINQRRARGGRNPFARLMQGLNWLFLDVGCGYGTNPFRAVASAVVLILLFALVYAGGIANFEVQHPPLSELPKDAVANRLLYGLVTSVSVFTAGFTGDHLQTAHGWVLAPLASEALMGTLLWGLFIVAFSRKVIR